MDEVPAHPLRYVALGDSYTIGTSVEETERFPDQLVTALADDPVKLDLVANLGVDGYTAADLIRDELPELGALRPDFLSLLIGVNDVVQGVRLDDYAARVAHILASLLTHVAADRIVVASIPDYTVTPSGADYGDPRRQHDAIVANNTAMARLAAANGIAFVDIFALSREAALDRTLVARDGLHPSGLQYARWVDRMLPVVRARLKG
jgi:lysophospholipase L1-like esterase